MYDNLIIMSILVLFPILLYYVYISYIKINSYRCKIIVFELLDLTSLYFALKYGNNIYEIIIFSSISIIFSYLKYNYKYSLFLSVILCLYCIIHSNIYYIIIHLLIYFILYLLFIKKYNKRINFINAISSYNSFLLSIIYFSNNYNNILIIDFIFILLLVLSINIFILYIIIYLDKLADVSITLKELEHNKNINSSLFKLTHEIKNPLAVCMGYLEMINLDNRDKTTKYLKIIKSEIDRSLSIMADFKELNKVNLNKEYLCINDIVYEVYDSLILLASNKNIKISFIQNKKTYLNVDYIKIKQVLINIIKNSIESIESNGIIEIKCYKYKKYYVIKIKDNGLGMDKETLTNIYTMFFTTKSNGTGLGVSLSNEIIKAHNGILKYKSKINSGTEVTIKIPLI